MKRKNKCANKKKYNYRHKAEKASLQSFKLRGIPTRIYECPTCLDFHLTSKGVELSRVEELNRSMPQTPRQTKAARQNRYRKKRAKIWRGTKQILTPFYGNTRLLTIKLICGLLKKQTF